jgi:hypothetical protein
MFSFSLMWKLVTVAEYTAHYFPSQSNHHISSSTGH